MTRPVPVLSAVALTKQIKGRTIVDSISLDVAAGEVVGFLGPNGAGKTTTIRMLVGLIKPSSGSISLCGFDLRRNFEDALRCVGCIVETPDLYRFMSGRENLEHFSRMLGRVDPNAINEVARLVDLEERLDDRVSTYSLGMRQRLGIAQALLGSPRLLILDEPANGLDPAGIHEIRSLLRSLARDRGIGILISSHLLAEIELICDRVIIIHRGNILRTGSVRELISSHATLRLTVSDSARATALLNRIGIEHRLSETGQLEIAAENERVAEIVRALVGEQIDVTRVERHTRTLEELFLETTGGETVEIRKAAIVEVPQ